MEKRRVYFDNNATTPLHPEVKKAIIEAMDSTATPRASTPSGGSREASWSRRGKRWRASSVPPATRSCSWAAAPRATIRCCPSSPASPGAASSLVPQDGSSSPPPSSTPASSRRRSASRRTAWRCIYAGWTRTARWIMDQLKDLITENTGLVSVMMANNEIGTIQDIRTISDIAHAKGRHVPHRCGPGSGQDPGEREGSRCGFPYPVGATRSTAPRASARST